MPRRRVGIGLALVGLTLLAVTLHAVGGRDVVAALQRCAAGAVVLAAVLVVMGTILGAWNCWRIADLRATLPFLRFLRMFWRSWAVGISVPGQVGDLITTLWQLKGRSTDLSFVAGRLLVDKVITLALMLAVLALVPIAIGRASPAWSLGLASAIVAAACAAPWVLRHVDRYPRWMGRWPLGARLLPTLKAAHAPRSLVAENTTLSLLKILASGGSYWVVLSSISSASVDYARTTVISQSAGLVAYLPISFNGIGTVELSAVAMFRAIGLDAATVVSAYLVLRTVNLVVAWLPVIAASAAHLRPKS